jgi:hypothetical protein
VGDLLDGSAGRGWRPLGWIAAPAVPSWVTATTGFLATGSRLWRTTDGGRRWQALGLPPPAAAGQTLGTVAFLSAEDGFVTVSSADGSQLYGLWDTEDGGRQWQFESFVPYVATLTFRNREDGFAVITDGWGTTTDGGAIWHWHALPPSVIVDAAGQAPTGAVWLWETTATAAGASNRLVVVPSGGGRARTWPVPPWVSVTGFGFGVHGLAWLVADNILYGSRTDGRTWIREALPMPPHPFPGVGLPFRDPPGSL